MNLLHLWDNSWHVLPPNENLQDSFGRSPRDLELNSGKPTTDFIKSLALRTIGDLMDSEMDSVLVFPNSFREGSDELKDQYIFQLSLDDNGSIKSLTTNNIIGFIGSGNTDIRIHSRFYNLKGSINDFFLYYMLERVLAINLFKMPTSSSNTNMVFDFLLFFFPKMLKEALSQGLYKSYVYHEYNDANLRGVIDINRHIRHNIPANGHIAYRTREFSYDNSVTQLIRHTIEFIRRKPFGEAILHNDGDTETCVQQIIQATPSFVSRQQQTIINNNLRPFIHPYYTKYAALQKLCLSILRYEKLSYDQSKDKKIHGLLIDAAWLWEEYLACVLTQSTGLKHFTRNSDYHLLVNSKTGEAFQKIIPDYLDEEKKLVADAKYIPLVKDELSADRAAPVYYKTIMYMYRFNAKHGFLFHPVSRKKADDTNVITASEKESFTFCDYSIEGRPGCHLFKVGLVVDIQEDQSKANNEDEWKKYREIMSKREEEFVSKIQYVTNKANPCGLN
jgi:5-methylcytosine-specific restriction endonuclease McrBC regulatory subunit McrC